MIIEYLSTSHLDSDPCQLLIFAEKQKFVDPLALSDGSLTEIAL